MWVVDRRLDRRSSGIHHAARNSSCGPATGHRRGEQVIRLIRPGRRDHPTRRRAVLARAESIRRCRRRAERKSRSSSARRVRGARRVHDGPELRGSIEWRGTRTGTTHDRPWTMSDEVLESSLAIDYAEWYRTERSVANGSCMTITIHPPLSDGPSDRGQELAATADDRLSRWIRSRNGRVTACRS